MYDREYFKRYRLKNKEKLNKYHREWRERNISSNLKKERQYYHKNKKRLSLYVANRRWGKNRDEILKKERSYRESNIRRFLSHKFSQLKKEKHRGKKQVKYKCEVTLDFLVSLYKKQKSRCAISNKYMSFKKNDLFGASIDRIDNNFGYMIGNVQLVCQGMNFAKNKYSNKQIKYFWLNEK